MHFKTDLYRRLRNQIEDISVIDCHDHTAGVAYGREWKEPIQSLIEGYFPADFISAGGEKVLEFLRDPEKPTAEKWPVFEKIWKRTEFTSYARVPKLILKRFYGEDKMTLEALLRIKDKLVKPKDETFYHDTLKTAGIRCRLVNIWIDLKKYIRGELTLPEIDRLLVPLPGFHAIRNFDAIHQITSILDRHVTSLDEYVDCCHTIFAKMKDRGTIGMKDQSAYTRSIRFEPTAKYEAEVLFNKIVHNPRNNLGYPEAKPLDDYLFHCFMRSARDLDLPVQIHTGHMAGNYNDIVKTNAALFTPVLELHRDVKFDLFHGNWPYSGELLYLAKNFPNVHIDLCWVSFIDPVYSASLLSQSLVTVPHCKIHGFGADTGDMPEYIVLHLEISRDVIAYALTDMIQKDWIDEEEAIRIAKDWLFNNPNEFFKLGFDSI
ncbi:amidohydrolase family protein [candidate division KSB1 bacterium]|nr:amidohydrolase family protein [candidate division KSB1 bacterium]